MSLIQISCKNHKKKDVVVVVSAKEIKPENTSEKLGVA